MISTPSEREPLGRRARCRRGSVTEPGRDEREQEHRVLLGEAEADEPVRAVVAAALVDRPPLEQPHDGDEARCRGSAPRGARIGRISVATVVPATFQLPASPSPASAKPSICEPESPMNTSARPFGRRLKGRKPAHASPPASANASTGRRSGWTVTAASIAKNPNAIAASVAASPSMLSSRLNAFVIPERARGARSLPARTSLWTSCTVRPGREHDPRPRRPARRASRAGAGGAGRRRGRRAKTSAIPRVEAQLPPSSARTRSAATASQRPALKPAKIPDPAEHGRRALVPPIGGRERRRAAGSSGDRSSDPDRGRGSREGGDRRRRCSQARRVDERR